MRTVIFDLDGTLADTSGDLIAAANHCFERMGFDTRLDPATDAGTALRGGKAMLTLGLERAGQYSADLVETWYPELLSAYGDALDVHTVMYPGAMEAVETLKSNGMVVGICTNKPEGLAETLMSRLGVRAAFGSLVGADTLPTRKPDAAPYVAAVERAGGVVARSCLIGDTKTDRDTARAVGVACVLVGFGPSGEDMAALEPDAIIQHFDELPGVANRLLR
ncbi:HAD hydrolase-like protein [Marivita hallyeonensis]|uniref:phosphoglycolate phosphatase n=1 Tax=Marivita hallyeonensis TaxID=996342 RepID=A0A1M5RL96_9RHOB|nr:HAD hydrolase-like protein [Marivita hallyeonensis]SHH26906.1 phosphoglycolate phosphatase [Marivita hallyeonensis]